MGGLVRISEAEEPWQEVPLWIRFLMAVGYRWPANLGSTRRVGIVSMPCDSAAAGLVALGAMCRRLELPDADDRRSHFGRILKLAKQEDRSTVLIHKTPRPRENGEYIVTGFKNDLVFAEKLGKRLLRLAIREDRAATEWRFKGEPIIQGQAVSYDTLYAGLFEESVGFLPQNMSLSDCAICLAGRAMGSSDTRETLAALRFHNDNSTANLAQLLTVYTWDKHSISRISFYNTRTNELDRNSARPRLVVADGDVAFLKVIDRFPNSDVVGVFHRAVDRSRLDDIGQKLSDMSSWYAEELELEGVNCRPPRGINLSLLKRRTP